MGGHDRSDFFRDRSSAVTMVTDFRRESAKIGIPHLHSLH